MKSPLLYCFTTLAMLTAASAQEKPAAPRTPGQVTAEERERLQKLTAADHADMLVQLGITKLRPGVKARAGAGATNVANYEEALANPFPDYPNALLLKNGLPVTTAEQWPQRRAEILADFENEVIGQVPAQVPNVKWEVTQTVETQVGGLPVVARQVMGHVANAAYPDISVELKMAVVVPVDARGPVPVLMMFGGGNMPSEATPRFGPPSPIPASTEQLIAAGWGYVFLSTTSIQADNGAGLTSGIIGLTNHGKRRTPEQWGSLRAWAWGAGRALDYLETLPAVDAKRVGIEGVSRYGKAALVTMACEPRFAVVLVGSSGEGGAKPHRRNFGEAVENLTAVGEYHWMAGNFLKYGAAESRFGSKTAQDLPVDAHELIALCAPRPTFISYGIPEKGDATWLDQQGSYMATVAAGPVFRLLGAQALGEKEDYRTAKLPPVNTDRLDGQLAWRQHDGGHEDQTNLSSFLAWANRLLKHQPPPRAATVAVMRADRASHLAHIKLLEQATQAKDGKEKIDLYFLGDSITRRWAGDDYPEFQAHWKTVFAGRNAGNFGWGGDQTQHILWRLEHGELDGVNPKVIVLLAGTNNLGAGPVADSRVTDIIAGVTKLVETCRQKAPDATVILTAIFPRNDHPDLWSGITRINDGLAKLADGKTVRWLNLNAKLAHADGTLHNGVTGDQLHLSLTGYQLWAAALQPLLAELLGPQAGKE